MPLWVFSFLYRYLLYLLRLMIHLSFKSVAAQLNISNDKSPVFMVVECGDVGSIHTSMFMDVEGFLFSM